MKRPIPLMLEVEPTSYTGFNVAINGVPMYHRPDSSSAEYVVEEFLETLSVLMRRETGYPLEEPGDDDD